MMSLLYHYGYLLIFAVLAVEGTGMPGIPLEVVFLGAGYLIQDGRMSFPVAVAFAAAGNVTGNLIGYFIGAAGRKMVAGRSIREGEMPGPEGRRDARRGVLGASDLAMVKRWFARYGALTVFIGRWFGPIRTPAILASGFTGVDVRKYFAASLLGASTWCFVWQLAAWKLGTEVLRLMRPYRYLPVLRLRPEFWAAIAMVVLAACYFLWSRVIRRNNRT